MKLSSLTIFVFLIYLIPSNGSDYCSSPIYFEENFYGIIKIFKYSTIINPITLHDETPEQMQVLLLSVLLNNISQIYVFNYYTRLAMSIISEEATEFMVLPNGTVYFASDGGNSIKGIGFNYSIFTFRSAFTNFIKYIIWSQTLGHFLFIDNITLAVYDENNNNIFVNTANA